MRPGESEDQEWASAKQNNRAEVLQKQGRNYESVPDNFLLGYS